MTVPETDEQIAKRLILKCFPNAEHTIVPSTFNSMVSMLVEALNYKVPATPAQETAQNYPADLPSPPAVPRP